MSKQIARPHAGQFPAKSKFPETLAIRRGMNAVLVGETLMHAKNAPEKLAESLLKEM
jgi:hypothetical protein